MKKVKQVTTKKSAAKKTPEKKSTSKAISEDKDTEILRSWVAKAEKFGEKDSIDEFASELDKKYEHDYGTCVHAAAAVAKAAICKASRMYGLSGFQHGEILHLHRPRVETARHADVPWNERGTARER